MSVVDALAENIVNPKCDECGAAVHPEGSRLGPHLCVRCEVVGRRQFQASMSDYVGQERPRRKTIHVVKLPDCMR